MGMEEEDGECNEWEFWNCEFPGFYRISGFIIIQGQFFLCYTQLMIIVGLCLDSGK